MEFPEALKITRQKQFLSQEALAWETGKSVPNLSAMKKIKEFCENKGVSYEPLERSRFEPAKDNQNE